MEYDVIETIKEEHKFAEKHMDTKLKFRMRFFIAMYFVMVAVMVFDIYKGMIQLYMVLVAVMIGVGVGVLAGRIFNIHWNPSQAKVVARLDRLGFFILIAYIAFTIFRKEIFAQFVHGSTLTAFIYCFATGAVLGRLLSMRRKIQQVVDEKSK